jgi:NitT/TauT family transport system substrate-binding protein
MASVTRLVEVSMSDPCESWSRREFVSRSTLVGTAGLLGLRPEPVAAEPLPETTRIRLVRSPAICISPLYLAEELLRLEGFTEVEYVQFKTGNLFTQAVAAGQVDLALNFIGPLVVSVEDYTSVVILAGVHAGCFELFGSERIRAIRDLKGKTIAIPGKGEPQHVFLASMLSYVGIDPRADIAWVTHPFAESARLLSEGKIDAYLGIAPEPQELRARKIGRLMVDSAVDRPWSQYFCCMAYANRDFVRRHPAATKRALRAILKAADLCAAAPAMAAQTVVTKGYTRDYGYAFELIKKLPYNMWRTQNHEDSLRFYALRLHEAGMIKLSPQKILSRSTDWRFLNELKKELKG